MMGCRSLAEQTRKEKLRKLLGYEGRLYFEIILRLYSPKESFFDKTWRPTEIELVK
jgi:hypothetical protein